MITFNGKPVPEGRIVFSPKSHPEGYGAMGVARIDQGKIISHEEKKVVGGNYSLRIMAFDGIPYTDGGGNTVAYGQPLFMPQHAEVNLPNHDASLQIDVIEHNGDYKTEIQVSQL